MSGCPDVDDRMTAEHFRAVDNTPWDATAALSECSHSDTPHSCFASICAAEKNDSSDPDTQDHWALPHHKHAGGPANKSGVTHALGRVDGTDNIDKGAARAHLEKHAAAWGGGGSENAHEAAQLRAAGLGGRTRGHIRADDDSVTRVHAFRAQFRHAPVVVDGKELTELDGYASVVEQPYEMWDMFGPYEEKIAASAFDATLAANPDVAFLLNHRGLTMARTHGAPQTLWLDADPRGLHSRALVNPRRTDVSDMLTAIDDGQITEMSFAFMIEDWEWDEDYEKLTILQVDINRGDVSAVNFGANPYTSISARAQEFLSSVEQVPEAMARMAFRKLGERLGVGRAVATLDVAAAEARAAEGSRDVAARATGGRDLGLVERLLDLQGPEAPGPKFAKTS